MEMSKEISLILSFFFLFFYISIMYRCFINQVELFLDGYTTRSLGLKIFLTIIDFKSRIKSILDSLVT